MQACGSGTSGAAALIRPPQKKLTTRLQSCSVELGSDVHQQAFQQKHTHEFFMIVISCRTQHIFEIELSTKKKKKTKNLKTLEMQPLEFWRKFVVWLWDFLYGSTSYEWLCFWWNLILLQQVRECNIFLSYIMLFRNVKVGVLSEQSRFADSQILHSYVVVLVSGFLVDISTNVDIWLRLKNCRGRPGASWEVL